MMLPEQRNRPAGDRAVPEAFRGAEGSLRDVVGPWPVRGVVRADLRSVESTTPVEGDAVLARRVQMLAFAPMGADVVVQVAAGQFVPSLAVGYLRAEGHHLGSVTVECSDPATVRRWVLALRGEDAISW